MFLVRFLSEKIIRYRYVICTLYVFIVMGVGFFKAFSIDAVLRMIFNKSINNSRKLYARPIKYNFYFITGCMNV